MRGSTNRGVIYIQTPSAANNIIGENEVESSVTVRCGQTIE